MTSEQVADLAVELFESGLAMDKRVAAAMANDPRNWPEKDDDR